MKESDESTNSLIPSFEVIKCQECGAPMKKVSWKITAGAFDAGKEVEQTVFECSLDGNFLSIEASTGKLSEFAIDGEY